MQRHHMAWNGFSVALDAIADKARIQSPTQKTKDEQIDQQPPTASIDGIKGICRFFHFICSLFRHRYLWYLRHFTAYTAKPRGAAKNCARPSTSVCWEMGGAMSFLLHQATGESSAFFHCVCAHEPFQRSPRLLST